MVSVETVVYSFLLGKYWLNFFYKCMFVEPQARSKSLQMCGVDNQVFGFDSITYFVVGFYLTKAQSLTKGKKRKRVEKTPPSLMDSNPSHPNARGLF